MDSREKKRRASKLCMRKLRARRGIELSIKNSVRSVSISKDDNNRCSDNNFNITTHGNGTENVDNVTDELIDYDCQTSEEEDGQESDENAGENNDGTDDNEHSDDDNMNNGDDHPVQPDVNEGDEEPEPVYENEDDDDDHMTEIGQLKEWATTYHIPQAHLDILLSILRRRLLPGLPKSSKTFLDTTNAQYTVEPMEDADGSMGEFAYIGIEQGLKACVNVSAHDSGILNLQINCDGLQLSKSSCQEIWPLLIKIHSELASYQPFTAALYKGKSKPKNPCDYLKKFILEMNELLANGIEIDQRHFEIRIHCFICDTPARAFIKSTKGHAGFHACERCQVIGYKMDKTTVFTDTNQIPRDDLSFREQSDNDHHTGISPLIFLMPHINMILAFVLDFMHLGFLGVMAKLLDYWCSYKTGKFNISPNLQDEISRRINLIKCQIPSDFQRKLRTLKDYSKYKATELKFFALYAGPILLKDILDDIQYNHFVLFNFASRLLWCKRTAQANVARAKTLFHNFFHECKNIYTNQSATLNMHNLTHVSDDVATMKCSLSEMTAFTFENHLGKIKRLLRSPHHTVAQLCRRLHELSTLNNTAKLINKVEIKKSNHTGITKIQYQGKLLTPKAPDNMVLLKNGEIFEIKKIARWRNASRDIIYMQGVQWKVKNPIYNVPGANSAELNLWELKNHPEPNIITRSLKLIDNKMVKFELNFSPHEQMRFFAMPLLHD